MVTFNDIPRSDLAKLNDIQEKTDYITEGRIGLYLDVELDDSLHEQLGWTEDNDRLFFVFNKVVADIEFHTIEMGETRMSSSAMSLSA